MMGVLAFLDPTHLFALSSHYAARTLPYAQAMANGLAQLARLPGGPPDVTVAIITAAPVDGTFGENLEAVHGTGNAAVSAFVRGLLRPATGLDVLILGRNAGLWTGPTIDPSNVIVGGRHCARPAPARLSGHRNRERHHHPQRRRPTRARRGGGGVTDLTPLGDLVHCVGQAWPEEG